MIAIQKKGAAMQISSTLSGLALAAALLAAGTAQAATQVISQSSLTANGSYYTNDIGQVMVTTDGGNAANIGGASGRNDDGYRFVNLGFDVTFFGNSYNSLYINNNGNLSFGSGISAYVPTGPTGAIAPVISAFFGDVDTRNAASGVVHYQLDTANQLVVTWDNVGRYSSRGDLLNSFQIILRGDNYLIPAGEGSIGFFYKNMAWETTDTSTVAAAGFGDGAGNAVVIEGSAQAGLNTALTNKSIWFNVNLEPVPPTSPVPEPATWAMMIAGFGLVGATMRRRRRQTA